MADAEDEGDARLQDDVLSFLGAWARLQDRMDWLITFILRSRLPELGDVIADRLAGRLNDADRMTLLRAAAKEVEYSGDLTHVTDLFNRAKRIRNLVAHFYRVSLVYSEKDRCHRLQVSYSDDGSSKSVVTLPDPFPSDGFQLLSTDCTWLMEHVEGVLWQSERHFGVHRHRDPSPPSARPDSGRGLRPLPQAAP